MAQTTFSIPNISCGHCTHAIENELGELEGVKKVVGNIETKSVDVDFEAPVTRKQIMALLKEINYPAAE